MKTTIKLLCYFSVLLFPLLQSCSSQKNTSQEDSKLLKKMDSLIIENRKLSEQLNKPVQQKESLNSENNNIKENLQVEIKRYAFVVLTTQITEPYFDKLLDKMSTNTQEYSICSPVRTFDSYNEEVKYQFMDEVQAAYMKGRIQGDSYSTKIADRQCLSFESYEEASKEREKYLIRKN